MQAVRVKYEGDEPTYSKNFGLVLKWEPGVARLYPKRLWERERPRGPFKVVRGRPSHEDEPLPHPTFPDELSQRQLESSVSWYRMDELKEMKEFYSLNSKRFHRNIVEEEIERREGEGETD